eukprot:Skav203946  [mRNA]  locus=scaffold391:165964:174138:- [translate_table: standard]
MRFFAIAVAASAAFVFSAGEWNSPDSPSSCVSDGSCPSDVISHLQTAPVTKDDKPRREKREESRERNRPRSSEDIVGRDVFKEETAENVKEEMAEHGKAQKPKAEKHLDRAKEISTLSSSRNTAKTAP